jgi:hypothetical protein
VSGSLSFTQRQALREADRSPILCEPELYIECDAGGLTIFNIRRAVSTLIERGLLSIDGNGDTVITDKGRALVASWKKQAK